MFTKLKQAIQIHLLQKDLEKILNYLFKKNIQSHWYAHSIPPNTKLGLGNCSSIIGQNLSNFVFVCLSPTFILRQTLFQTKVSLRKQSLAWLLRLITPNLLQILCIDVLPTLGLASLSKLALSLLMFAVECSMYFICDI